MKAKYILLSAIVISLLLPQLTFAAPPRYEIVDLGTLGGIHSAGRSINDKGQVVGYAENSLGLERATLFDPTGKGNNIDLGTLDGQYSDAYSINRAGQIVGKASNASGYTHATLFHPTGEGNNIDLGTLDGNRSEASSINDNGQIVGWAQIA
ncbi:MAG: HAF repeat-containing protein, partial [Planctomycetota bacterium]